MKRFKFKFPYIITVLELTPEDIEQYPDQSLKEAIVKRIGLVEYNNWVRQWESGVGKPKVFTNTIHIKNIVPGWFSSPERFGMFIGATISIGFIGVIIAAAGFGAYTLVKFITGLI